MSVTQDAVAVRTAQENDQADLMMSAHAKAAKWRFQSYIERKPIHGIADCLDTVCTCQGLYNGIFQATFWRQLFKAMQTDLTLSAHAKGCTMASPEPQFQERLFWVS